MKHFVVYVYDKLIPTLLLFRFTVEEVDKKNALKCVKNEMSNEGHNINSYVFGVAEIIDL